MALTSATAIAPLQPSPQTEALRSLNHAARADETLQVYRKVAAQQITQPRPTFPPSFLSIEPNKISGEARCLNLLLVCRATAAHDVSWQERGSRPHLLGQAQYSDGQWLISYVKHGVLASVVSERFASAEAAAIRLYSRFQELKEIEAELERRVRMERDAA